MESRFKINCLSDRKNRVNLLDVVGKKTTVLFQNPMAEIRDVTFSPDSKWLTYSRPAENQVSMVYVYDIAARKEYPVTDNGTTLILRPSVQTENT